MPELQVVTSDVRRNVLTIAVEDYFQAGALGGVVATRQWARFEKRVEHSTRATLDLLDACEARATFFVLGWIASEVPELLREIVARGHEVASKGYYHRNLRQMAREEFREDALRSREAIERAARRRVLGYRIANGSFGLEDLWALDVLAEEGFAYDSSVYPRLRSISGEAWRRFPFRHAASGREIWEVPLSSLRAGGICLPFAGGNLFRQMPHGLSKAVLQGWTRRQATPFVLHFHVWELDAEMPTITAAGVLARLRQHRNVGKMQARLEDHLRAYRFTSVGDYLGMTQESLPDAAPAPRRARKSVSPVASAATPVTVVVPCFNEELALPYLANTLQEVARQLGPAYALRFVFVDDGSTDGTWAALERLFGSKPGHELVRLPQNQGVAAAILAGIRAARTEVVCSIDCDCTYDPAQLREMLPLLEGVDLVTASPYHPKGSVVNVPEWRLFLSKSLSRLYRAVLPDALATYTSCFRVYRRSAVADLTLREGGFLGIAEMLGLLSMRGARIVEHPAVLEVRMLGRSKMKVAKTIAGHLRLLARLGALRLNGSFPSRPAPAPCAAANGVDEVGGEGLAAGPPPGGRDTPRAPFSRTVP